MTEAQQPNQTGTPQTPKHLLSPLIRWPLAGLLLLGAVISFSADRQFRISTNQLFTVALAIVVILWGDVEELVVGPFLRIRRAVDDLKQEQTRIAQRVQAIAETRVQQVQQTIIGQGEAGEDRRKELAELAEATRKAQTENEELRKRMETLAHEAQRGKEDAGKLRSALARSQETLANSERLAQHWEFQYLNLFYVLPTKQLLQYVVQKGTISTGEFLSQNHALGITGKNFENTLKALIDNRMIEFIGDKQVRATDKAKQFLAYIGPVASPVAPSTFSEILTSLLSSSPPPAPSPPPHG